ncbi:MAG: hemerythrin family protein [Candidatus Delongbacteria bacterium]|nr:hemerythrin family protein [Candidatus Delongbacteria bacterium]
MALIEWNESLSVKIQEIDLQHQKLIALINDLNDAMHQGKGKDVLGTIIREMITYTKTHFATEERYFDLYKYQDAPAHKKEHQGFVDKVTQLNDQYQKGKAGLTIDVMLFLSDWLKNHISGSDKKYMSCLVQKKC